MNRFRGFIAGLAVLLTASVLWGQIPKVITYQGLLKDSNGVIVADGNYDMRFQLYDGSSNQTATILWTQTFLATSGSAVPVNGGLFTVQLGGPVAPLDALNFDTQYWLEISIYTTAWEAMLPLVPFTTVPYAVRAAAAEEVQGTENVFPSSGSVGIGTLNPSARLEITGIAGVDGIKFPDGTLQTSAATSGLWSSGAGGDISYSSGNVGIGTTAPTWQLELVNAGSGISIKDSASLQNRISLLNTPTFGGAINLHNAVDGTVSAKIRGYAVNGVQAFFTAGHVGFGTAAPLARIHAIPYDPTGVMIRLENNLVGGRIFDFAVGATGSDINLVPPGGFSIIDVNIGSPRLTIDAVGNVGIGIANPATLLHIGGTPGVDGITFPDGTLQTSASPWALNLGNGDVTVIGSGKVGIGTATPSTKLQVAGTVTATAFAGDGSALTGLTTSPWGAVTGGITYTAGKVGIGVTAPNFRLDLVDNTTNAVARIENTDKTGGGLEIHMADTSAFSGTPFKITAGSHELLRMTGQGRLGIGDLLSFQPFYKLHVVDTSNSFNYAVGVESSPKGFGVSAYGLYATATPANSGNTSGYGIKSFATAYGSGSAYGVYSHANPLGTGKAWAFYGLGDSYVSGTLGIGTTNALSTAKLQVAGDVYVGSSNASAADIYLADRLIDWDNVTYYLDPSGSSSLFDLYVKGNSAFIGASATSVTDLFLADRLIDWDNTAYYMDLNGTSNLYTLFIKGAAAYIGASATSGTDLYLADKLYDWDNAAYYLDPNAISNLYTVYIKGVAAYIGATNASFTDLWLADRLIDWDNTAYYLDPNSTSVLANLTLTGNLTVPTTTRYLSISNASVNPITSTQSYTGTSAYISPNAAGVYLAPLNMPHGASVKELWVTIVDNDPTYNIHVSFYRKTLSSGSVATHGSFNTSGPSTSVVQVSKTNYTFTVDNNIYAYYIYLSFGAATTSSNLKFYGGKVVYTVTNPLP